LGDFGVAATECLDDHVGAGSLGLGSPKTAGKAAVKCEKTIDANASRFLQKVVRGYQRCSAGVFKCMQLKPGAAKCAAKADAKCQKLAGSLSHARKSAEGRFRDKIAKACGPSKSGAAVLDLAGIRDAAGLGYEYMESRCSALGVPGLDSLDEIGECI